MTLVITEEIFTYYVGRPPENDDLERCNCPTKGVPGHWSCGWNDIMHLPNFMCSVSGECRELWYPAHTNVVVRSPAGVYSVGCITTRPITQEQLNNARVAATDKEFQEKMNFHKTLPEILILGGYARSVSSPKEETPPGCKQCSVYVEGVKS